MVSYGRVGVDRGVGREGRGSGGGLEASDVGPMRGDDPNARSAARES